MVPLRRVACSVASRALLLGSAAAAIAQDFVVDSQFDAVDVGDGPWRDHRGDCTLRAAVQEASAQPGQQTIALGAE